MLYLCCCLLFHLNKKRIFANIGLLDDAESYTDDDDEHPRDRTLETGDDLCHNQGALGHGAAGVGNTLVVRIEHSLLQHTWGTGKHGRVIPGERQTR